MYICVQMRLVVFRSVNCLHTHVRRLPQRIVCTSMYSHRDWVLIALLLQPWCFVSLFGALCFVLVCDKVVLVFTCVFCVAVVILVHILCSLTLRMRSPICTVHGRPCNPFTLFCSTLVLFYLCSLSLSLSLSPPPVMCLSVCNKRR